VSVVALAGPDPRLAAAAAAQAPEPARVVEHDRLRAGLERALASGADWIWVLDGSAAPRPDALAALLAGLDRARGLPAPSLLTGVVVGPDGRVAPDRGPWYRRFQIDLSLQSADRGLAPVRAAVGPALVAREAAAASPPPARARLAPTAVFEWTARLLRERTGYLVPESRGEALTGAPDPLRSPLTAARLILSGAVVRPDRVAVALELSERAGRPASAGRRP
jgi:hypothetical protein